MSGCGYTISSVTARFQVPVPHTLVRFSGSFAFWNSPRRSQPRCAWGDGQMGAWRAQTKLWQWITRARGGSGLAPCLACEFSPTANIADTFLQPVSPGIKADNIYAVFHLFASEVPRFRIPGSRFRFRGFPPAIEVVTDRYKVPGSGSITQRGTPTGANCACRDKIKKRRAAFAFCSLRMLLENEVLLRTAGRPASEVAAASHPGRRPSRVAVAQRRPPQE